ncbi:HAD family hydrolase [Streptomyces griseiscabiei]|uniref:HAD family hydrolase n=1 Tax=Streptomyces griseiscabiei TaxID=2993540 RepID=A0ABU4LIE8_9ACTN|nr:HAD family hydrolase [Streptomyces griseiscabiei]MBZ3907871.1 HAD family hydrolase [Streptomyces griseiscabiei]MDX2915241.1 HAD family hydrolase [Streptomyces griseiscabiei]
MTDTMDDQETVVRLLTGARAVLFDFDGPVCDLFHGASTAGVAEKIKQDALRYWPVLDPDVAECDDSHGILRHLWTMYDSSAPTPRRRPLRLAERTVAAQERAAVRSARETPGVVTLVDLLTKLTIRPVMVSNNAEGPIRSYLKRSELKGKFRKVCGRDPKNAGLMKPHPDCVHRALKALSLKAPDCLLIGDQLTDLMAARSAGVAFLGFTQDASRARQMTEGGAAAVVSSYAPVISAAERLLDGRALPERRLSPATR